MYPTDTGAFIGNSILKIQAAHVIPVMPVELLQFSQKLGLGSNRTERYRIGMNKQPGMSDDSRLDRHPSRAVWIGVSLVVASIAALAADAMFSQWFNVERLPGDIRRLLGLSEIFAHGAGVVLAGWCIWQLSPGARRCLPRLFACAFLPGLAANAFKLSVCRLRPAFFGEQMPQSILDTWVSGPLAVFPTRAEYGVYFATSFPSGHAATAFGLAIGLSWLFPAGRAPFYTLATLATIQRITSGAHWLSDALVGMALAFLIAGSLTSATRVAHRFSRFEVGSKGVPISHRPCQAA